MVGVLAVVWSQANFSTSYPFIALIEISEAWKSRAYCHFHLAIFILRKLDRIKEIAFSQLRHYHPIGAGRNSLVSYELQTGTNSYELQL